MIGAVLGFIGSLLSTFGKSKDVKLDVRTKVVTNERAHWRKDMRELSAEYVALSNRKHCLNASGINPRGKQK